MLQSEYDRFMKFEDCAMAGENSRNNRIRMEDPFSREPENTKVFTHIRDIEVAKYIMGSSYLEKDELDEFT